MDIRIEEALRVISILSSNGSSLVKPDHFSSHEFIGKYIKEFEDKYIDMLVEYRNRQHEKVFKGVNAQIGKFLSDNQEVLGICSNGKVNDKNVHHLDTANEEWTILSQKG